MTPPLAMDVSVSKMVVGDLDEVMAIENVSFPLPWPRNFFVEELAKSLTRAYTARKKDDRTLIGYCVNTLVLDELHILNVAAHPQFRRMGISKRLIKHSIETNTEVRVAFLEVRENNAPAKNLYFSLGFKVIGRRKAYYDNGEDALTMAWIA